MSLFKTVKFLSFSLIAFSLFILSASGFFLLYMHGEMCTVFRCSQLNCPCHSFLCFVALDDSHFPLMLSCWCSMHHVRTLFFDLPIYLPLHKQSNWYTSVRLFGSSLVLFFWQRICCQLYPNVKAISLPIFLTSCFIFRLMFGIQGNFFRFLLFLIFIVFVCIKKI